MTNKGGVDAGNSSEPEPQTHPQTDGNASFLRAARAGNLEKVLEYLKGSIDINTSNANGLNALHLASKEGHVAVVNELLKRGANVNAATKKGNTALHIASLAGQEEVVKILVRNGANVNVQSQNGFTPLYMAAQENHDNVVRYLLANGANQSLATEDGFTPLAVALQQGHDKVVAVLLENDTKGRVRLPALHIAAKKDDCKAAALLLQNDHDPDVTSKSGFTPLHIASHYGNENIAHLLLEKSADVNFGAKHQITPLHVASKWGKKNMVNILVEHGAKIDASTRDGLTPLHCAARSGHDQVVDLLLEKGAPITAKTKNGLAPLHMAAQGDHVDGARILLYHKAPVDDVTVDYLTALHVAAHCGHVKVAKLLLDRKADANARALNGFTPLHIACKKNRIKVVELLLKHGASIEATTESGLTPLHVASFMGCMNIVIYLIQHGANPDVPTVRGETPLHLAARANQADIIRILLRNGAHVDACAREQQTPLHIAARLGNVDIVGLLLQHGAAVDATTKDMYTALHIAAKEGQEEVASVLLDNGASLTATNKKGFTPLHLAAKYGNIKVARLLLQKDAHVDAQGKNGVTPLHVAAHYDHVNVALLLLDKGASPHATAKNGYTPLHIAAKKNQMDIATTLLEYGAKPNAESKAGFTPLHLAAQEGHTDMTTLLIEHHADVNFSAKNGLTPLHLCAQEDRVNVAAILVKNGAEIGPQTKAGYTPLHVACHFGQINMVRFLLQHGADVNAITSHGYTPLHQAAQQGHTLIINLLLENNASPNTVTNQGQTALSIAQRLGYISVVETLKVVTETVVTTTTTTVTEEKYKVVAPEIMQETFMSDSEDEGGEDLGDQSFRYLTVDEMKSLGDDSLPIDVTKDERGVDSMIMSKDSEAPLTVEEEHLSPAHVTHLETVFAGSYVPDNVDIARAPVHAGFLVSFMVDARGGAMRGCRHSGVRVIIPPRKAPMPMRITCRYLRREKLAHPPPLMEGEACASRILEVGPAAAKFLGPVILEIPHFASLRGREREITILRSDNGETWREHTLEATEDAVHDVLNESFEGEELSALEDLNTNRITRILTTDFPQYFAIITRVRQEVHAIGPEGGMVSSTVVPQVQAIFPEGALTKKIKVGLQAQPIPPELVAKLLGNRVAVSPIVTVEPRRRKFHKPITLTIPVPQAATKGMINQYSGDAPTLRLLCSITGGTTKAQWEDVTGSTPLTFVNDCVSFTTTVSARFWLMDCRQVNEATRFATELYKEAIHVPFMAKFVVFAKRYDPMEAYLRVFCMTDDKEDKTLESQEHFVEVAKSRDVEVLEAKCQYLEFAGNLIPVTKSGEQLFLTFQAFRENRLPFIIRVKDPHQEPMGRLAFMREPRVGRGEPPQSPICNLNIALPDICKVDPTAVSELVTVEKKYGFIEETGLSKPELIHRADLRLSDISKQLGDDWIPLALQLDIPESDINSIKSEYPNDCNQQAIVMLRLWMQKQASKANGNTLEKALRRINREDIVSNCMFNVELVTDDVEKAVAKVHLDQSGFDAFKEELGPSRDASLRREASLEISYDEQDLMKEAESAAETSSESGSVCEKDAQAKEAKKVSSPAEMPQPGTEEELSATKKEDMMPEQPGVVEVTELPKEEKSKAEEEREDDKSVTEGLIMVDVNVSPPTSIDTKPTKPAEVTIDKPAALEKELLEDLQQAFQDVSLSLPTVEAPVQSIKEAKTPPPSPADREAKADHETTVREKKEVLEDGTIKHTVTTVTKTTVTQDGEEPLLDKDQIAKLVESETWPSGEMDTSQVSVSSLPEDEKSEPTTATMSSGTTAEQDISSTEGDKPQVDTHTEEKEWTETDESGGVRHVIQKKTIVTVSEPEEIMIMKGKAGIGESILPGTTLPQGNSPDEKEEESLSFAEKRDFFQRLSMTAGEMPQSSSEETKVLKDTSITDSSSSQPEEVIEEKVTCKEVIVEEQQISFSEKLRMFEEGKDSIKKLPDKGKEDNEQKFDIDKEELTESEIAALEYLEGKGASLEEGITDDLIKAKSEIEEETAKSLPLKETTSLDAVEQEVASMLAEVDRQSRELLGHAVGLLPEGEQFLTESTLGSGVMETEQEKTEKHILPDHQFPSEKDASSTEFQNEVSGRALTESEQKDAEATFSEKIEEKGSSHQVYDEHDADVPFWPPQPPTAVKDENIMPEQQTAAGKTTTEDTVLPSPSRDTPSSKETISLDTSHSVHYAFSGMEVDNVPVTSTHLLESKSSQEGLEVGMVVSAKVQQQIKSQILSEELDQSIEENPPEEKMLGISKLPDIEREKKMTQHIKTTILFQELEADIESGSPERKEFPSHSSSVESGFEAGSVAIVASPTQQLLSAIEQKAEQITWEAPIQEQLEDMLQEEIQEIPREKQFIVEHDEEEEQVFIEQPGVIEEATILRSENHGASASSPDTSLSESISTKEPKERYMHPSLDQIPSEISDEDLVERDQSPSEHEIKYTFETEETSHSCETDIKKDTALSEPEVTKQACFLQETDQTELHHEMSSDDVTKTYDIAEAEEHVKQVAEHESHVDSYSSEGSDYTQRDSEPTSSSGAASEVPHYKSAYRQDSSETSERESFHPLYVTAETLYTSKKKDKKSDSDPSSSIKEDHCDVIMRQKSSSKQKDENQMVGDIESWSSSGETESHYYSFEASDSSKTPQGTPVISRPCSSEFEVTIVSGQPSSEYDTCVTSQEASVGVSESYATAVTSQETSYSTACSSFSHSSRESAYSVDSESSGHLASLELSSEASETLVPSAQEIEMDLVQEIDNPILEEDTPSIQSAFKEPYDSEIPECIIRGGIEVPFLQDWSLHGAQSNLTAGKEWPCGAEAQVAMSPFEIITTDELAECLQESYDSHFPEVIKEAKLTERRHDVDQRVDVKESSPVSEKTLRDSLSIENEDDRAESEKYLHPSKTLETEPHATALETENVNVPGDEDIAEQLSHDELSISESSATQSEQTWQTSSIETAIHISQQMPSCFMPYTETPPVTRVDSTYSDVTTDQSSSPSHTAIAHDSIPQPSPEEITTSYQQLNGPVEVDYIPEYDAPFPDAVESSVVPPAQSSFDNQLQSSPAVVQEWQPSTEIVDYGSESLVLIDPSETVDDQRLSCDNWGEGIQLPIEDVLPDGQQLTDSEGLWHTESEQVELDNQQATDPSVTTQSQQIFGGEASCLPESDQDTLHSWELVHPSSEQYQSGKQKLETRDSFDMTDKAEAIDTSPEDDRYDNLLHDVEEQPCVESKDDSAVKVEEICYDSLYQQDQCLVKKNNHAAAETTCESQTAYAYSMGFEKEHGLTADSLEPSEDRFQEEREGIQDSYTEPEFSHIPYERGQEYDDVSLGYGELYTHQEEDEETEDAGRYDSDRRYSTAATSVEDDKRSTPSYDTLSIRKFFGKSGEHDDMSVSSLQEFERLEAEIAMGSRMSQGSGDSNGRQSAAKSGEQDDVSMNSLTEFEKFEKECTDGDYKEFATTESGNKLSEIEEGHESLSEASQATLSDHLTKHDDSENSDDYDKRMSEIDEIIKQAQTNIEKFDDDSSVTQSVQKSVTTKTPHTSSESTESSLIDMTPLPKKQQESLEEKDKLSVSQETQLPASIEREQTEQELELSPATLARHIIIGRTISGHSVESGESLPRSSTSTVTQYDAESLKDRDIDIEEMDVASTQDKKISPTEDEKYFPQELDHDDFSTRWGIQQQCDQPVCEQETKEFPDFHSEKVDSVLETEDFALPTELRLPCDTSGEVLDIQWNEEESYLSAENLTAEIESLKAETAGSGHSSSNGKDGSGKGDCMISSTDSIDPSSSTATHATYQFETDSVMSSSINSAQASGEEFTMISSTDTLEAEPKVTHVREHAFEEIPEGPRPEQQILLEGDGIDSTSYEHHVTIQVGTEEYESLPYEVKEKLNRMLAEPAADNEYLEEGQESAFYESSVISSRKSGRYSHSGIKKTLKTEYEGKKTLEMQDEPAFLSEDHFRDWRDERAEYILGQTHMLSQFQYDGQALRDSGYSMPEGTEALLYHPISPGVSPTAHQTHRSESDLDEPETFLMEADETTTVSHGISPVTGRKDLGDVKDNGTIEDDDDCTVTTRIVTKTTIKTDGQDVSEPSEESSTLRESMQQILDDFMSDEASQKKQDGK